MMEDVSSAEYTHKSSFAHEDRNIQGLKPSRNGTFGQVLDKGIRQVEQFGITSELSCPIPGKRNPGCYTRQPNNCVIEG